MYFTIQIHQLSIGLGISDYVQSNLFYFNK